MLSAVNFQMSAAWQCPPSSSLLVKHAVQPRLLDNTGGELTLLLRSQWSRKPVTPSPDCRVPLRCSLGGSALPPAQDTEAGLPFTGLQVLFSRTSHAEAVNPICGRARQPARVRTAQYSVTAVAVPLLPASGADYKRHIWAFAPPGASIQNSFYFF